jgi:hypothetical protein
MLMSRLNAFNGFPHSFPSMWNRTRVAANNLKRLSQKARRPFCSTAGALDARLFAMFSIVSAKLIRFVLTPSLALWIAGAGCLLGCNRNVLAATSTGHPHDANTVVADDACASQQAHECCAKKQKRAASPQAETNSNTAIDFFTPTRDRDALGCPLAANRAVVLAKSESMQPPAVMAIASLADTRFDPTERVFSQTSRLIPPNHGHTYLRCCVFLI